MKKYLVVLAAIAFLVPEAFSQNSDYIRPKAIGVSFVLNDFSTPERIRNTSTSAVLKNKEWSKIKEMTPGVAVTYFKGLKKHIDFASTLAGSFVKINLPDDNTPSTDKFLLEADASVNLKMFSDQYIFTPYLNVGVGASMYNGDFGAFLPLGGGFKINLFDEAAIFLNSQYRVPVIKESNNYHFFHSIGIAGTLGKK